MGDIICLIATDSSKIPSQTLVKLGESKTGTNLFGILINAILVIKTYFGAVVVKRCDVSTCYDRSWSRMSLA